jgi:hypothetical protein
MDWPAANLANVLLHPACRIPEALSSFLHVLKNLPTMFQLELCDGSCAGARSFD